jgi:glycosyltransferase involved in cell wall biosynthesis
LPLLRQWWFAGLDLNNYDLIISITGNGEAKFAHSGPRNAHWISKWFVARGASEDRKGGVHTSTLSADRSLQQSDTNQSSGSADSSAVGQDTAVRKPVHISYCHTPVHFYWRHYKEYLDNPGFKPVWLARLGLKALVGPLKRRDYAAAQKVDHFIANSSHISADIKKYYNRDSVAIYPPVNTSAFSHLSPIKSQRSQPRSGTDSSPHLSSINPHLSQSRKGFVLWGRHVPMKRIDIAIEACNQLKLPLTIIGSGPITDELKKLAGPTVTFTGRVSDEELTKLAVSAEAFIFPSFEDFGIAPVEALAAGTPVIAYKAGGALDFVIPGKTGEFFTEQTVESLATALQNFKPNAYDHAEISNFAEKFSAQNFKANVSRFIKDKL